MRKLNSLTVSELVPEKLNHLDEIVKHEMSHSQENAAGPRVSRLGWRAVREKAGHAIHSVLNFDIRQIFGRAWCEAAEMHALKDASNYPHEREWTVSLGKHPLKITIHPDLTVTCASVKVAKAVFNLDVEAEFRSAVLGVRGGRITAIWAADCEISTTLKYADTPLHPPLKSGEIELVDRYEFQPPGLAIL